jgi:hypothetical protein
MKRAHLFAAVWTALAFAGLGCEKKGGPVRVVEVEPNQGTTGGGDHVTIVGSGFEPGKTQAEVRFGRRKAESVVIASTTQINVTTPAGDRGPVDVEVMLNDGKAFSIPGGFKYVPPADPGKVREAWLKNQQGK